MDVFEPFGGTLQLLLFPPCVVLLLLVIPCVVGTLLEVPALEAALTKADHAFVPLAGTRWRWREDEQWPPITAVKAAPIFKLDQYDALRGRLRQRAPTQAGHPSSWTCLRFLSSVPFPPQNQHIIGSGDNSMRVPPLSP